MNDGTVRGGETTIYTQLDGDGRWLSIVLLDGEGYCIRQEQDHVTLPGRWKVEEFAECVRAYSSLLGVELLADGRTADRRTVIPPKGTRSSDGDGSGPPTAGDA